MNPGARTKGLLFLCFLDIVLALSLPVTHPYLSHSCKEVNEKALAREMVKAEEAVARKDKFEQIPLKKFSRENRRRVEVFNTYTCDRLTKR